MIRPIHSLRAMILLFPPRKTNSFRNIRDRQYLRQPSTLGIVLDERRNDPEFLGRFNKGNRMRIRSIGLIGLSCILIAVQIGGCSSARQRRGIDAPSRGAIADAITSGSIFAGMTKSEVRESWGEPADISVGVQNTESEIWKYDRRSVSGGGRTAGRARAVVQRAIYTLIFDGYILKSIDAKKY